MPPKGELVPEEKKLEKQLVQALKKSAVRTLTDTAAIKFLANINKLQTKNKQRDAAAHYAALALVIEKNASLALQAAKGYQKAKAPDAASRWFLITAERYANSMETSKSVAALRMYSHLQPEDKSNPKRIYDLCLQHGANEDNPPSILVDDADIAGGKLLANDFFKTFDSSHFDDLLKNLTFHKFKDGHVITKMGEEASSLYIVISGAVSGYLRLNNKRTYLGEVDENGICGETAYFTGGLRTAEMIAKGDTEVFELPYHLLDRFKTELPSFNQKIEKLYRNRMLVKQLALTPLFEGVRAHCREWIATKMKPYKVKAGQTLFKQNDKSLDLYLVRCGKLSVCMDVAGTDRLIKTVETCGIVGETAIIANKRRTASVRAVTDCIVMKLESTDYETFYAGSEPIRNILKEIQKKQVYETFDLMRNIKHVEGDDTCEILIKDTWS